jgi:nucleoside-diphosphate-sugar epimerase
MIPERPLVEFDAINPYTVSKAMAEYMLWTASAEKGIPLTVLRLGSVIGHSRTGWVNDTRYGYYSYLQAFKRFLDREPVFSVDIDPERTFPVIHIDHMADLCHRLRARTHPGDREIFHICDTGLMTVAEHFRVFEEVAGGRIKIAFGPGAKSFNQVFNKVNADNNRFMGTRHGFDMTKLAEAVGEIPKLERSGLEAVITAYVNS